MFINKMLIMIILLSINSYAKYIFAGVGVMGSQGVNKEHYLDTNSNEVSWGDTPGEAILFTIGTEMEFNNNNFRIEPALGYRKYYLDTYDYSTLNLELPLLYKFHIGAQQISFGPEYKIFYNSDITSETQKYNTAGSKINTAYGFKVLFEYQYVDLFLFYEYLTEKVNFSGDNGYSSSDGYLDMRGGYLGYGLRAKY